jgi:hypothetical protein
VELEVIELGIELGIVRRGAAGGGDLTAVDATLGLGTGGIGLLATDMLKAEPISLSVSLRARTFMLGAMAGT